MNYDLEERTSNFGISIIRFCKSVKISTINQSIINQVIRSGTSIGANYCEANGASSKKDFRNKIHICKKEAQETRHWLKMMKECFPDKKENIDVLKKECQELTLIFGKISSTLRN